MEYFYLFACLIFILAILSWQSTSLSVKLALIMISLVPSSMAFEGLISESGIYIYDIYLLAFLPVFLEKKKLSIIFNNRLTRRAALVIIILTVYFLIAILDNSGVNKYILRDARLILLLIYCIICLKFCSLNFSQSLINKIIIAFNFFHLIAYFLFTNGVLGFKNEYYENNSFRYFGLATYLASIYFIIATLTRQWSNKNDNKLFYLAYSLCLITILIAGYRMLIVAVLFAVLIGEKITIKRLTLISILSFLLAYSFIQYSIANNVTRVTENLSFEGVVGQFMIRFEPSFVYFQNINFTNILFGYGFGSTFYIPWFEYQGLDTFHNVVDSTYITLFVKFGLFSIFYLYIFFKLITVKFSKRLSRALVVFFLISMVTFPLVYHGTLSIVILFLAINPKK
jgi:hypothetical protein